MPSRKGPVSQDREVFTYHTRATHGRKAQILSLPAPQGFFETTPTMQNFLAGKLVQALRDKRVEPSMDIDWDEVLEPKRISANVVLSQNDAAALANDIERFYKARKGTDPALAKAIGNVVRDRITTTAIARHLGECSEDIIHRLRARLEYYLANSPLGDPRWPAYMRGRLTKAEREASKTASIVQGL